MRLTVSPFWFDGYVRTDEDWFVFDHLAGYGPDAVHGDVVVYRESDLRPKMEGLCGTDEVSVRNPPWLSPGLPTALDNKSSPNRILQVGVSTDGELYQRYGIDTHLGLIGVNAYLRGVLNGIDGIYERDLNIDVRMSATYFAIGTINDGFDSFHIAEARDEVETFWNQAPWVGYKWDMVQHFSGKEFSGDTVGIALMGKVCRARSDAMAVAEDQRNHILTQRIAAHEIAHTLNAFHLNLSSCAGVSCNGVSGPIMCSSLQKPGSGVFTDCVKNQIGAYVDTHGSCL